MFYSIWCTSPPVDGVSYVGQVVVEAAPQISTYGYKIDEKSEIEILNFKYKVCLLISMFSSLFFSISIH